ncbi:MAG TPA: radical SAM protein, partial [bacterium]|nr:radical SAM protein [bacterium]
MQTIYTPKGRALEYSPLALNLHRGCSHACTYCYAPAATFTKPDDFYNNVIPRKGILKALKKTAPQFKGKEVLLCFTSDPYQPIEKELRITREAIKILQDNDIAVNILTKGALLAERDFDLLRPGIDKFGVTLTFTCANQSREYEPFANAPIYRMEVLREAHQRGLYTWVSLEPVIKPECSIRIIHATHTYVDEYKIGKWNHKKEANKINWRQFLSQASSVLNKYGKKY